MIVIFRWMVLLCTSLAATSLKPSDSLESISVEQFCTTEGRITRLENQWMRVDSTKMRAVLGVHSAPEAEIHLRYLGQTHERSLLRSGAERTQIGLKLRAQDDCNVVYVMWRINPVSRLVVSVKSNPGHRSHAVCENFGYDNIRASRERPVPKLEEGSEHSLRAVLNGTTLVASVDSIPIWEGNLTEAALHFDGPVGLRSDNARFDFRFFAHPESQAFPCGKDRGE